ncbi:MAG: transcription termination/antitermination protein NusA [Lachnospiraceae bacterium]|nr:transcription termination/antitermination protein NusA [Lachnospiraceae bacterium]MBQ4068428.1 transcription termination/antitermination protein NusA [Lachnospiraceae bacterium]
MNKELIESLEVLEKEKGIDKEVIIEAIENSLFAAYKNHVDKVDNIKITGENVKVNVDRETGEFTIKVEKTVVDEVEDKATQISLDKALEINKKYKVGDVAIIDIETKEFGRIATQNAKNIILQKIREEEKKSIYEQYFEKQSDIVTGIVQRINGNSISIDLGKAEAILSENEQVKGEVFLPTERVKLYVAEVREAAKGLRIVVSRTRPELVKRLFEEEVTEIKDGTVEIKSIAREAGSRTKMAVWSNNKNVDPVGACVGMNGARVNAIVNELRGEKIDIISWSENPAELIEHALSPAIVVSVVADDEAKTANVVVPDYQLSLAIGKEGQNARLAARLTGFKIDIKSESQAGLEPTTPQRSAKPKRGKRG